MDFPEERASVFERAFSFLEHPLVLAVIGLGGSIAGVFIDGKWVLLLCVPLALGLHRSGAVKDLETRVQVFTYLIVLLVASIIFGELGIGLNKSREHFPSPQEIAKAVITLFSSSHPSANQDTKRGPNPDPKPPNKPQPNNSTDPNQITYNNALELADHIENIGIDLANQLKDLYTRQLNGELLPKGAQVQLDQIVSYEENRYAQYKSQAVKIRRQMLEDVPEPTGSVFGMGVGEVIYEHPTSSGGYKEVAANLREIAKDFARKHRLQEIKRP